MSELTELLNKVNGVVFDFNGTLFLDNDINEITWCQFIKEKFGRNISDKDFVQYFHGVNLKETLEHYAGKHLSNEEITELGDFGKETLYRNYIIEHPDRQVLTEGTLELFEYLKDNHIPFTIATASRKVNLDFFRKIFNLDKYFDPELIVYDNGYIKSKPDPEIYKLAFEKINVLPEEGVVFEDALTGLNAAHRAGSKYVVAMDPKHRHNYEDLDFVNLILEDFNSIKEK